MRTIWKFFLDPLADQIEIVMPEGAKILCVQTQGRFPCVWALVDDQATKVRRILKVRGTGHDCDDVGGDQYLGSFQIHGGSLVFHVFDGGEV